MFRFLLTLPALVIFGLLSACGGAGSPSGSPTDSDTERPLVVATTPLLGDLARRVAGDAIDVEVLIPPGADPHDFEPSAAQAARLRDASLIIANGLGLEENLESAITSAEKDGVPAFQLGERLDPLPISGEHADEHADDGDHHDTEDPHFWLDPERMSTAATLVAERLTALDPASKASFDANADAYSTAALQAMSEARTILSTVPESQRKLITNHDALAYFANRFGLEVIGTVIPGGSTMAEPSAADLKDLVELVEANGVRALFSESTVSSKLIETVSREVGSQVRVIELSTDTLGGPGSETATYPQLILTTARLIANGLSAN